MTQLVQNIMRQTTFRTGRPLSPHRAGRVHSFFLFLICSHKVYVLTWFRLTVFTGADARRAAWNTHYFTRNPINFKVRGYLYRTIRDAYTRVRSEPGEFRNRQGSTIKPQRVIKTMKGAGTEFPINKDKHGYQDPLSEKVGPARAIVQKRPMSQTYIFRGVVSHDERTRGHTGGNAHYHLFGKKPWNGKAGLDNVMRNLFG